MEAIQRPPKSVTKDELNLVEFPFSLPCHRHPRDKKVIHIAEKITDPEGTPRLREWIVTGSTLHGLPLAIDEEVFLGLLQVLQQTGFQDRHASFTQYSFLRRLGWPTNAPAYARLKHSLDRLRGAVIESRGTFWDHKAKSFVTRSFNLIDNYALYERENRAADQPFLSSVTFNEFLFESFQAGFIKTLDFDFYLSLRLPISRKLFRLLDKRAFKGETFRVDLDRLAQRLAITDSAYPSKIKQHLEEPHRELTQRGVLKKATYLRSGRSPAVSYTIAPSSSWKHRRPELVEHVSEPVAKEHPLLAELVSRGISKGVALSLLAAHDEKRVADKLEVFDFLRQRQSPMASKNPPGFLRDSIEKDYAPPPGYVSRAEREKKKIEEEEAKRREREAREEKAKAEADRVTRLDAVWNSLSQQEQAGIQEIAIQSLNSFALQRYREEKLTNRVSTGHHALKAAIDGVLSERYLSRLQPGVAS